MTRRDNWPAILDAFIAERMDRPFAWAENNCALLAADWVLELTGVDLAEPYRSQIKGPLSAVRIMRQAGGLTVLVDEACAARGWPTVPVEYARRGDLVLTQTPHGPAIGVSVGHRGAFAGPDGLTFHPRPLLWRAWQIA